MSQLIVVNKCYGGFSLSHEGIMAYAEVKGWTLYPEGKGPYGTTYWRVPEGERVKPLEGKAWEKATTEERLANNKLHAEQTFYDRSLDRDDPALVEVVQRLGEKANGAHADLHITEIPDGVKWEIEEYDGQEWVAEAHMTW
jgi:hypothetical protein